MHRLPVFLLLLSVSAGVLVAGIDGTRADHGAADSQSSVFEAAGGPRPGVVRAEGTTDIDPRGLHSQRRSVMKRVSIALTLLVLLLAGPVAYAVGYEYDELLGRWVREGYVDGLEITYAHGAVGRRTPRTTAPRPQETPFLADGFESGDTGTWSTTTP